VFNGPALPKVSVSVIRRTHPSWLRWGRSSLPLPSVHGPWLGQVRGQRDDTLRPHGVVVRVHCEDRLAATAALPITLLMIQNQENPARQQRLEAVSDLEDPHSTPG
jgi:hypothetical protein